MWPLAIPIAMGALSVFGSMAEEASQNAAMEDKAKAFGVRKAGIMASKESALEGIVKNAAEIQDAKALAGLDIEKNAQAAEAQARVNAATAGVAGSSVDVTIDQAGVNEANAKNKVNRKNASDREQLKLSFVNSIINAETSVGSLDTSTTNQTGKHIMSGVSGFLGGLSL